jgi:hypothetical protein
MRSWRIDFSMVVIETVVGAACSGDDTVIIFRTAPFS